MLKYLIIPLANNAISFCHYRSSTDSRPISSDILKKALIWAMKENVSVQFLYPEGNLPGHIIKILQTYNGHDIVPSKIKDSFLRENATAIVFDHWKDTQDFEFRSRQIYVVKSKLRELPSISRDLEDMLTSANRLNFILTDIQEAGEAEFELYKNWLDSLIPRIVQEYSNGHSVQINLLTDRLMLTEMNNCNAGHETVTLAPDGSFYICPAFFYEGLPSIGNLNTGLNIKNPQLFKTAHAPICRTCDAFQCKRCVWLNRSLTREINTPGYQQCVLSHIERNASRDLLIAFRNFAPDFLSKIEIPEIDYLDPFENIMKKQ